MIWCNDMLEIVSRRLSDVGFSALSDVGFAVGVRILLRRRSTLIGEPVVTALHTEAIDETKTVVCFQIQDMSKGTVEEEGLISTMPRKGKSPEFLLCVGDDR
ncbi:hypothetical protein VNO77_39041 [Canavalia gladiata]|uniref:Uncharacterized protein n=1 Tax=Canavalia gladiata TaxID=3824 RepID=A0AAN9KDP5_CANGL